jgi:hypothetical protein
MHEPLKGRIEEYLQGDGHMPDVEQHLEACESCRQELTLMSQQSELLRTLRTEVEPSPGFYARVLSRIDSQTQTSVWSIFSDSLFAKRLSYASITFLLLLGTYFVSTAETNQPLVASSPESILAGDEQLRPVGTDPQRDREVVLVNLATFQE